MFAAASEPVDKDGAWSRDLASGWVDGGRLTVLVNIGTWLFSFCIELFNGLLFFILVLVLFMNFSSKW